METYEMRSMFTLNMEGLQLRLFQFSSLLNEILPDLAHHLSNFGVHAAMYASQWFLTLFAYVFPIKLVTRIYDIIFAEGAAETIMRVAIAMLKRSQSTLLEFHEFEDILDFVTTKKLCAPYEENYSHVVRDAMSLSDIISRDKMDHLCIEYENHSTMMEHPLETGRFGFWKRKANKPDMRRSASSQDSNLTTIAVAPVILKKRWSSVSSRKDWSYRTTTEEDAMQDLKLQHQKTLNELLEMKYDKQDLECERDALKLTILELERCHLYKRGDTKSTNTKSSAGIFDCDNSADVGTRSFSDLAVATKEEESISISRQNSIHHSMLSSSSQSYTTTEFDDDDQLSLSLTTTTVPIFTDEDELSSQIVHLKVKNFELEQHVDKLNGDVEAMTSKFDMVNEGHMMLVDQLVCLKSDMEACTLETEKKDEALHKIMNENEQLKQELDRMKKSLTYCRIENGVLNQDLELLKQTMFYKPLVMNGGLNNQRIRRHSTTSSSMLTLVRDHHMYQLEQSLTAANIKVAENDLIKRQEECGKKKSSIYGRVLHAIKYNS